LACDTRDIPFLREDQRDAANIQQIQASTITALAMGGFTRTSAIAATVAQDMTLLEEDPNWISVQLQAAGGGAPPPAVNGVPKALGPSRPAPSTRTNSAAGTAGGSAAVATTG
jgi:hypothetical protein